MTLQKHTPAAFTEPQLLQFCQAARYINLTKEEQDMISAKTKARWDYYNVIDGAKIQGREEGEARGRAEGKAEGIHKKAVETAIRLKAKNMSIEEIAELTDLSIEEIETL